MSSVSSLLCHVTIFKYEDNSWWRHQMETFSALLAICAGNSPVPGEFPAQRPVTRSFDVFFDLRLNKRLSKQSLGWWFETPSSSLWRHCNVSYHIEGWPEVNRLPSCPIGWIYTGKTHVQIDTQATMASHVRSRIPGCTLDLVTFQCFDTLQDLNQYFADIFHYIFSNKILLYFGSKLIEIC